MVEERVVQKHVGVMEIFHGSWTDLARYLEAEVLQDTLTWGSYWRLNLPKPSLSAGPCHQQFDA